MELTSPPLANPATRVQLLSPHQDSAKAHEAAVQFEALLIGQLLQSVREASSGDPSLGGDQAGGSLLDLGQQEFAQMLAAKGGLGLAKLIEQGLTTKVGSAALPASGDRRFGVSGR